jgi:hypothetical protein
MKRSCGAVLMTMVALAPAPPAQAQTSGAPPGSASPVVTTSRGFLTRYAFHLNASSIAAGSNEGEFTWDADLGGELDLLDFGRGRITFLANYETILGHELRYFDPQQSNYTLDLSGSVRVGRDELTAVFHHISRHLSDRGKTFPIDWNMVGVRYLRVAIAGPVRLDATGRALAVVQRSYVDYSSELGGGLRAVYRLSPRASSFVASDATWVGTDRSVAERDGQFGAGLEAGVRLTGNRGAVELFLAFERRIDADPLMRGPRTFTLLGFRLLGSD